MTEDWKFQISPKINDQLVNVRGETAAEFAQNLADFPFDAVAQFAANLNGAGAVANISQPSVPQAPPAAAPQQAAPGWATAPPAAPAAAPAAPAVQTNGFCSLCSAPVQFKTITAKATGKQFDLWACPNQRTKGDGHHSEFVN